MKSAIILSLLFGLLLLSAHAQEQALRAQNKDESSSLLSFDELVALSSTADPEAELGAKLNRVLATPVVNNDASAAGVLPHRPAAQSLGPVLRVGMWNIERGLKFSLIRAALTDTKEFESQVSRISHTRAARRELIESQLATLQNVDVLVLNEVDLGMKRTDYRDIARELATALQMNYAYGIEFVEVDPVFDLGTQKVHLPDEQEDQLLQRDLQVDPQRYRSLHGTAILSRYPIRNARIVRLPVCYDWYAQEAKEIARIEKGKRWAARSLFKERIEREIRHGGRMALLAELDVPESPSGEVTVAATHLENRCKPACRSRQMQALLSELKHDRNPLVIAGDLNTTGRNNTPTSLRNEIMSRVTDYQFWINQTISYFNPLGVYQHVAFPIHYFHGYNDPTAFRLPILWDNPEQPLFRTMRKFQFDDGGTFDFRGDAARTLNGKARTLSDSNQRAGKGFVPTYSFARDYRGLVGRFKLDWIMVKPFPESLNAGQQRVSFAPYFPETMRELNESVANRIADHAPMTVDLFLTETPSSDQFVESARDLKTPIKLSP